MRKILIITLSVLLFLIIAFLKIHESKTTLSGAPPYGEPEEDAPQISFLPRLSSWKRPDVPAKVALQVGHWKNNELPEELKKLRGNSGASGGGKSEWEVNLAIAKATSDLLKQKGVNVEILPATVPEDYWADVFLAIHADGNEDPEKRGFKVASPWRDYTGNAKTLVGYLESSYQRVTSWEKDPNITRNMRGYYAFSWWKYDHAVHPMTTAAIIETGFLTNPSDRYVLINHPEIPAKAISEAILNYLQKEGVIQTLNI